MERGDQTLPPLSWSLPVRGDHEEILDGEPVPRSELQRSLAQMAAVNRRLGGVRGLLHALLAHRPDEEETLSLLDVGTGNGALPRTLARELARRRGVTLTWRGVDLKRTVLAVARDAGPPTPSGSGRWIQADGLRLPFRDDSFDIVTSSLTLHHLADPDCDAFLAELARVARHRVLVSDLERTPLHYAGARLLAATVWRGDRITRVDGPLSVLRSLSRRELLELAGRGPFRQVRVRRTFPFRLLLEGVPG